MTYRFYCNLETCSKLKHCRKVSVCVCVYACTYDGHTLGVSAVAAKP